MAEDTHLFDLDPLRLDEEWLRQPGLYHRAALSLAGARADYEAAKTAREAIMADLSLEIRKSPRQYGIEKATDKAVDAAVIHDSKYQRRVKEMLEAKHLVDVSQALVDALEHRKKALENMVTLHMGDYFSKPRVPPVGSQEFTASLKETTRKKGQIVRHDR